VRLLLEAAHLSAATIALAVLAAAAVPWSLGMLWTLGGPELEPLRTTWPRWCLRLVAMLPRLPASRA
jgi:hypothetical protein